MLNLNIALIKLARISTQVHRRARTSPTAGHFRLHMAMGVPCRARMSTIRSPWPHSVSHRKYSRRQRRPLWETLTFGFFVFLFLDLIFYKDFLHGQQNKGYFGHGLWCFVQSGHNRIHQHVQSGFSQRESFLILH